MKKYLRNPFKKLKKDKKGAMTIEIIIGMMIFILGFCFIVDLFILASKYQVVSQTTTYVARTAGNQGGVLGSAPEGFPGGYISSSQMDSRIGRIFDDSGIVSYDVNLPGKTDYGEYMDVKISFDYTFALTSNFIPGNLDLTFSSSRTAFSEFKYRYDDFDGS